MSLSIIVSEIEGGLSKPPPPQSIKVGVDTKQQLSKQRLLQKSDITKQRQLQNSPVTKQRLLQNSNLTVTKR